MAYLQYENDMYWGRANFFLVASTALFGFFATNLPEPSRNASWIDVIILAVVCIAGLYLSVLWNQSLKAGEFWVDHWHTLLKQIEPQAFGRIRVWRDFKPRAGGPKPVRGRRIPKLTLYLFYFLWSGLLFYALAVALIKLYA